MSKDLTLLTRVSKYFTESTIVEILQKSCDKNDVAATGWTFQPPGTKGDSYLSQIDRVTIHGETAEGKPIDVKVIIKSLPKNIGRRKSYRSTDFFHNEITFYTQTLPELLKFIESKDQKHLLSVPSCLHALLDGENDYLVLQDVSIQGFGPVARLDTLDLDQMNTLLKAMANFHAVSFAYKDQHAKKFEKIAQNTIETYFQPDMWNWYKNFQTTLVRIATDALEKEYPDHPALMKFKSYQPSKTLWDKSCNFCARRHAPTSVINQGDSWAPNFLVRNIVDSGEKQALLLDFQLARVASPVLDIAFCVYSCSDKNLLDNHFDDMLKTYHSALASGIKALGSDPEKLYPWFLFQEEVQEQWVHGVNFAMEAVPFSMLEESEVIDLDLIKGDEAVDIAGVWLLQNITTSAGRHRVADFIVHAYSRGFL